MLNKNIRDQIKDGNKIENFLSANQCFQTCMGRTFQTPEMKKYFVDNYISDNKNAMKELESSLSILGETILFSAPTGSGKTTAVKEIFDRLIKKHEKDQNTVVMCILGEPTRAIAEQLAEDYTDIISIVGDEKNPRHFSLTQSMIYAVVLEKMKDVKKAAEEMIANGKHVIIFLILDECQHITTAQFRDGAVKETLEVLEMAKSTGSAGYMTATPEANGWVQANKYIFCEYSDPKAKFDELNLFVNDQDNRSYVDFAYDCVMTNDQKGLIRINDKNKQKQLNEKFSLSKRRVCKVCGDDKDFYLDEHGHPVYMNRLMNEIVRFGRLPDCDIALATCMFDAGENIKGIGENMLQDPDFCSWFCMASILDASSIAIIQYANRIRYHFKSYNIITSKKNFSKENIKFQTLEQITKREVAKCKRDIKHIQDFIKMEKAYLIACGEYDEESFAKRINHYINFSDLDKDTDLSYGGALEYKDGELILHENFLYGYILNLYNLQFYFDQDLLIAKLETVFGMKVNVIDHVESYKCPSGEFIEDIKTQLLSLKNDPRFIMNWTDDQYKDITKTAVFDDIMYLRELGMNFKDAIHAKCTLSDKELDQLKTEKIQSILCALSREELNKTEKLICKSMKLSDCLTTKEREKLSLIMRYDPYVKKLRQLLNIGIPIEKAIQISIKDMKKEIKQYQVIQINKIYKQDRNSPLLKTSVNRLQRIILDYVIDELKFNINGKNRITIFDERIEEIIDRVHDITGKTIKKTDVLKNVKLIFKCTSTIYHKKKTIEINLLKL